MSKEYPVYKYCYHNGDITKEKYIAVEKGDYVHFKGSECNPGPNGSRKSIEIVELNNPCTTNLQQGVYLTEEDDNFAIEHFIQCLQERVDIAEATARKYKKAIKALKPLIGRP